MMSDTSMNDPLTDDELYHLTVLPSLVGSVISFSDSSGPVGTAKEMLANAKSAAAGLTAYPDNRILQAVIPQYEDRKEAIDAAKSLRDRQIEEVKKAELSSKDDMKAYALSQVAMVNDVLTAKADERESAEYRAWVMAAAQATAEAAKEGGFLGIGGTEVSDEERAALDEIAAALGVAD
jgi:seryl-tRNA synthetase